jgi:hypothetical protein
MRKLATSCEEVIVRFYVFFTCFKLSVQNAVNLDSMRLAGRSEGSQDVAVRHAML